MEPAIKIVSDRNVVKTEANLILRSRAKRGVSKDGQQQDWFAPFETRPYGPLGDQDVHTLSPTEKVRDLTAIDDLLYGGRRTTFQRWPAGWLAFRQWCTVKREKTVDR